MAKLNKRDIFDLVAEKAHLSRKDARNAVDAAFDAIAETLLNGEEVNITNFGVFTPKVRKSRDGTDPKKHTRITIKETKTVTFQPSKSFKAEINK